MEAGFIQLPFGIGCNELFLSVCCFDENNPSLTEIEARANVPSKLCACARAHAGRKARAHNKTRSAQKNYFSKNVLHINVNVQKHLWKNIFCALHVFLLLLMYR